MPKKKTKKVGTREVLYNEVEVRTYQGREALTAGEAKNLLGWEEETAESKFGQDYLVRDSNGNKIRCFNNINNRPIDNANILKLKQEILRKRWFLNMENRIIGETGMVINGQHTLVALILAVQDWTNNPDRYPDWETEPTIETSIAFGVEESDDLINTIDTGRPRSLADVIYRSEYFDGLSQKNRREAARCTEYAVKILWHRTGIPEAFAIRQTHAESIDFIDRHSKLLGAVRHVIEENTDNHISGLISPGYAAGLLYLMGSSTTEPHKYQTADEPHEDYLDWELWDEACNYFVNLGQQTPEVEPVRFALAQIVDEDGASYGEKSALLCKGWKCIQAGKSITAAKLDLTYTTDEWGFRHLAECPTVGGIDMGDEGIPQPEPVEKKKPAKKTTKKKTVKKKKGKPNWVFDENGGVSKEE